MTPRARLIAGIRTDLRDLREWTCGVLTGHDPVTSLKFGEALRCRRCRKSWPST